MHRDQVKDAHAERAKGSREAAVKTQPSLKPGRGSGRGAEEGGQGAREKVMPAMCH